MKATDGSHLERSERLIDNMKEGALLWKVGMSTDRLQEVTPASALLQGRVYLPNFYECAELKLHFAACVEYVQSLGQGYTELVQHRGGDRPAWLICADPSSVDLGSTQDEQLSALEALAQTYLIFRGVE